MSTENPLIILGSKAKCHEASRHW